MQDDFSRQLAKLLFDYTILLYGYALPLIAISTIRPLRVKFILWYRSFNRKKRKRAIVSGIIDQPKKPDLSHLRNDYGQKIALDTNNEADVYFHQLQLSWK